MSKMKCFLCGSKYKTENREAVTSLEMRLIDSESGEIKTEPFVLTKVDLADGTLRLCPACVKAVAFGTYISQPADEILFNWTENIEFEEDK